MEIHLKKTNYSVQQLRGIAALAVVLCHYGSDLKGYPLLSSIFNYGQVGIHVFFYISGYIILHSLIKNEYQVKHFFRFLLKRVLRIDPSYITTIFLTLITYWLFSFISSFKGNVIPFYLSQFLAHIFYFIPFTKWPFYNHVFWTLCIEFQFYILVGGIYFINKSSIQRIAFILLFSATTFLDLPRSYYLITTYAPIFALGMATLEYQHTKNKLYLICITVSVVIIFIKFGWLILFLILISAILVRYSNLICKPFLFLGNISYSLYIIHPLVLIYLLGISKRLKIQLSDDLGKLIVHVIIAVVVAYIFFRLIEQPSIAFSKKVKYPKK